jgi:AraC-like DNA-binding protein
MPGHRSSKCTESTTVGRLLATTRYHQEMHGDGVNSWIFEYRDAPSQTKPWISCGIELGVQLRGEWLHRGRFTGARGYGPGSILRGSVGEQYELSYGGRSESGLQVGFIVCAEGLTHWDGELRFVGDAGICDRELLQFSEWFDRDPEAARPHVVSAVRAYVERHAVLVKPTPVLVAKRELERHVGCDLPMTLLAENVGLHPETFARQFRSTFGLTPTHYRVMVRTNLASRLLWMRPDLSIEQIAEECGFRERSYFFRTFARSFRMTPAQARHRFLRDAA